MAKSNLVTIILSDLEGRMELLVNALERINVDHPNKIFRKADRLSIAKGYQLIHLGDLFDHGIYDQELAMLFVNTVEYYAEKHRIPEPLILIAGNRDLNKTRCHPNMEMNLTNIRNRIMYDDSLIWSTLQTYRTYFFNEFASGDVSNTWDDKMEHLWERLCMYNTDELLCSYLQWMLTYSMGCGKELHSFTKLDTFNNHRIELFKRLVDTGDITGEDEKSIRESLRTDKNPSFFIERIAAIHEVSDIAVMYRTFLEPIQNVNGYYQRYLKCCKIVHIDNTVVYVHGGISSGTLQISRNDHFLVSRHFGVNRESDRLGLVEEVGDLEDFGSQEICSWARTLNEHYERFFGVLFDSKKSILVFDTNEWPPICRGVTLAGMKSMTSDGIQKLTNLLHHNRYSKDTKYQIRYCLNYMNNYSSTIETIFDKHFIPNMDSTVEKYLKKNGITHVFGGHQPYGNSSIGTMFQTPNGLYCYDLDITRTLCPSKSVCVASVVRSVESVRNITVSLFTLFYMPWSCIRQIGSIDSQLVNEKLVKCIHEWVGGRRDLNLKPKKNKSYICDISLRDTILKQISDSKKEVIQFQLIIQEVYPIQKIEDKSYTWISGISIDMKHILRHIHIIGIRTSMQVVEYILLFSSAQE